MINRGLISVSLYYLRVIYSSIPKTDEMLGVEKEKKKKKKKKRDRSEDKPKPEKSSDDEGDKLEGMVEIL